MQDTRQIDIHNRMLAIGANGNLILDSYLLTTGQLSAANEASPSTPHFGGKMIPSEFILSAAPGASTVSDVSIQLSDLGNKAISQSPIFDVWLSDSAQGTGLTATTPSGGFAAEASDGTIWQTVTASKAIRAQPNASGFFGLAITDSARTNFYVCVQNPMTGLISILKLTTANYG